MFRQVLFSNIFLSSTLLFCSAFCTDSLSLQFFDTGGYIVLEWIWERLFAQELSGSDYLYLLRSVLWHLWFPELWVTSNTQVNFFQHQISCFVRRPPILPTVGLLLVVLKSHLVLSLLLKWLYDAFSFLLTFTEMPGKFWNVVLEKDGEDQLDRSCEKWRSVTSSQWADEYPTSAFFKLFSSGDRFY